VLPSGNWEIRNDCEGVVYIDGLHGDQMLLLNPKSTLQIEELMRKLIRDYTIVIVTHNMQQAARASDYTAFMTMGDDRAGYVVEQGETGKIFTAPQQQLTADYVSGRFG